MRAVVAMPTRPPPMISGKPRPPIRVLLSTLAKPKGRIKKGKRALRPYRAVAIRIWY